MLGLGMSAGLAILLILAAIFAFEIWMFVNVVQNPRLTDTERLIWCAAMLLIHPFAAIVYYVMVYNKDQ
jgi:hypothetical protein